MKEFLLVTLVLASATININGRPKRLINWKSLGLWNSIDLIGESFLLKPLKLEKNNEKTIKMFQSIINESGAAMVTVNRLQTISVLSVFGVALVLLFIHFIRLVNYNIMYETLLELSEQLINEEISTRPKIDYINFAIVSLTGYLIPAGVLKFRGILKGKEANNEVIILQIFLAMGLKSNKNVLSIMKSLYNRSNVYKEPLRKAILIYSTNQEEAFSYLKKNVEIREFQTIVGTLEKALIDRELAKEYLENSRSLEKTIRSLRASRSQQGRQIVGTIMLFAPLASSLAVIAYPWLIQNMKLLNAMNSI